MLAQMMGDGKAGGKEMSGKGVKPRGKQRGGWQGV